MLVPKIDQNPPKNRFQEASKKSCIFASIFSPSWLHFGTQVGAMLAIFSTQGGGQCERQPSSLLRWCFLSFFSPPGPMGYPILGPHLGSILEVFGLILAPCWGQLGAILDHLGTSAGTGWAGGVTRSVKNFQPFQKQIKVSTKFHNFKPPEMSFFFSAAGGRRRPSPDPSLASL